MRITKMLVAVILLAAPVFADSVHELTQVKKVSSNTYEGTAGKTRLVLTTKGCYHEPPDGGEKATLYCHESDGSIQFSNLDVCPVTGYKEKQ